MFPIVNGSFLKTVKAFFATRISRQVRELFLSVMIVNFGVAMVAIFEPIYLYTIGFSINGILYFYLGVYGVYFFTLPLGAKFARKFGYEKGILLGAPFLALYYITLFLIPRSDIFIPVSIIMFVAQKTFYWPGYHADFARFGRNEQRGREISNLAIISSFMYVLGPLIGGVIINFWGFKALFSVATVLFLVSNIPLLSTPEKFKPVSFSYKDSFKRLFWKENRRNFFGFLGFGEELLAMVIWPVFIFVIIGSFVEIGSLVASATFVTATVVLFVGKMVDGKTEERRSILKVGSIFSSGAWLLRLLVRGALGVFLVDTLSRITKNVIIIPMMAMTYDRASETSVMKTIIFFEQALVVGKILSIILALAILVFYPGSFGAIFILGALMTLLYSLIKYEPIKIIKS